MKVPGKEITFKDRIKINLLTTLIKIVFNIEIRIGSIKNINYPKDEPVIFAVWHSHQCVLYGNKNRSHLHALISISNDGDIIAKAAEAMGLKTVRGSKNRKGAQSTLQLLDCLKAGDSIAITVDGPRGPLRTVKDGIINIAKISQIPIIPVLWYSNQKNFLEFKTWDKFRFPIGPCKTVALYGDPIFVPKESDKDTVEKYRLELENQMKNLYQDLKNNYEIYLKE